VAASGGRWRVAPYSYETARVLAAELGLSETTASVLVRRGFDDPEAARRFLEASERHDPFALTGIEEAARLVLAHARAGARIAVHGDYDVDGVCSTALLVEALRRLEADVHARLPSRDEGYGLSDATVEELHAHGTALLITADCGIGAVEEVALARRLGMDVVVTDHHRPGDELPDCPIVHPVLGGYPCPELCATGVVLKLAQALFKLAGRDPGELDDQLDIVGLATIADVVPLMGENRALAREGLRALAGTGRPGLRALFRVAGAEPQLVREHTVAFALAPRINAAGRLYRPDAGLELMLTDDEARALEIARELDAINTERQAVETRILFEAEQQLSADEELRDQPVHVLAGKDWHAGVIGIVASHLVERHHRPCVLVALDDHGRGRGSGRSISAYDLHAGLGACSEHLVRFGGHRMAAGLELEEAHFERFRAALVAHAQAALRPEDLVSVECVDAVVPGDSLNLELAEELDRLRPFGMGNPRVNLLVPAARVGDVRAMGEGRHARFTVRSAGVRTSVVAFGNGTAIGADGDGDGSPPHDLVARLEANEWQGALESRLVLRSLHPVPGSSCAGVGEGCAHCTCRARGEDWWEAVWTELESPLVPPAAKRVGPARTILDERGRGLVGCLGDLLSTGEPVAVATLDCSRRRNLLGCELDAPRFRRPPGVVLSVRCSAVALRDRIARLEDPAFALIDYTTIARDPAVLGRFTHVFALEPPPGPRLLATLREHAAGKQCFLHLGWGTAELELAGMVLEQEYGLRAPLAAVYRALSASPSAQAAHLEELLAGDGRHPRSPALVGRCLRVLVELGLVELQRSGATVRCQVVRRDRSSGRAELERSEAFRAYSALHREGTRFLSDQEQPKRTAKAA
jgi:single-stranded-DNA-specific exonuclease